MIKLTIIAASLLFLAGCATSNPTLIVTVPKLIKPPASLTVCNLPVLPDKFKSNKDVASFMAKTYNTNSHCKVNMDGIKKFYDQADKTIKE